MTHSASARFHLLISGRVQGVAYRASARDRAAALGLNGWVRNLPDGRVELVAEGPRGALAALLAWCRQGPRLAEVGAVDVAWIGEDVAPQGADVALQGESDARSSPADPTIVGQLPSGFEIR